MQCLKYDWKQGERMKRSKNSLVCVCHAYHGIMYL